MQTNIQMRELLTTYHLEESVLNLRDHDRLMVRQRLGARRFQAMLTSGEGGISLMLDAREPSGWHRFELLALARHAPRLMASAISTANFGSVLRDPACHLVYVAQPAKDSEIPAHLRRHVRDEDLMGAHLRNGDSHVEDWGIHRENISITVLDSKVMVDDCMCTVRFRDSTVLGSIWQSRTYHQTEKGSFVIDAFAEDEAPLLSHARKSKAPVWTTLEVREVQRLSRWSRDEANVEIWLERWTDS